MDKLRVKHNLKSYLHKEGIVNVSIEETSTFFRVKAARKYNFKNLAEKAKFRGGFFEITFPKKDGKEELIEEIVGLVLSGQDSMIYQYESGRLMEVSLKIIPVGIHTYKKREQLAYDYAKKLAEILLFG